MSPISRNIRLAALLGPAVLVLSAPSAHAPERPTTTRSALEDALPNDNRASAGRITNGVLTVALEAREVAWVLEGPRGPRVPVFAFAEVGKKPQVPGPLIRVNAGTEIRATIRNATPKPLAMLGLQDHASGVLDSVVIAPGATREFQFRVDIPGTYLYFGRTEPRPLWASGQDSQLNGAFIVDPAGTKPSPNERIFVIGSYLDTVAGLGPKSAKAHAMFGPLGLAQNQYVTWTLNGLSWPHTERLAYTVGDTVRWRVINAGFGAHPMHLHGFYFDVQSRGDALRDTLYSRDEIRKVVTEPMPSRGTMTMRWVPTRSGNWLFHCHLIDHIDQALRFGAAPTASVEHGNHAEQEMAGLVIGIKVGLRRGTLAAADPVARRKVRVFVNERANVYRDRPGYSFILQEGATPPAADSIRTPSSTIVLHRGEPTEITVINRSKAMASVHWHGIELESYYDGVADWSGADSRTAPVIAPNDSFVVRLTPDRAGTFIYHTHSDETAQLPSGLYGALIVLAEGAARDTTERILLLGSGGPQSDAPAFVNGSATPPPIELRAGVAHRLRFINIAAAEPKRLRVVGDSVVLWRAVAKDGADLPAPQATMRSAALLLLPGETFDFDLRRLRGEVLSLEITTVNVGRPATVMKVPVIVR